MKNVKEMIDNIILMMENECGGDLSVYDVSDFNDLLLEWNLDEETEDKVVEGVKERLKVINPNFGW